MSKKRYSWWSLLAVGLLTLSLVALAACAGAQPATPTATPKAEQPKAAEPTKPAEQAKPAEQPKAAEKPAASDLDFYKGKTVNFIVATEPGGGYDAYARLIAPILQKYLPGSTVIVKNVPGAGHIKGTNEIYSSKPDGLTFGTFNKGLIVSQLAGLEGIQFDLAKMTWLGNAAQEPRAFVVSTKSPFKTIQDAMKGEQVILASAGVGSASHSDGLLLAKILGLKVKMVPGYSGQEGDLAMMRGEVHGQVGSWDSMRGMVERGEAVPLVIIGKARLKEQPNVPLLSELAPAAMKEVVALMGSQAMLSRPIAGPPGMEPTRAQTLQDAFRKALADPDLLANAQKAKLPIDFMDGPETAAVVKDAMNQPEDVIKLLKEVTAPAKK